MSHKSLVVGIWIKDFISFEGERGQQYIFLILAILKTRKKTFENKAGVETLRTGWKTLSHGNFKGGFHKQFPFKVLSSVVETPHFKF